MIKIKNLIIILTIFAIIVINGCSGQKTTNKEERLTELQITACNSAHDGNTCDTKLEELEIITKEQCCKELGKCC